MNTKNYLPKSKKKTLPLTKAIASTLLLLSANNAVASDTPFKIAVIENTTATKEIVEGKTASGIAKLLRENTSFDTAFNLCAAYIKAKDYEKSEIACSKTIARARRSNMSGEQAKFVKSLSYSNRGISRYLSDDVDSAIEDLTRAISINDNVIAKSNLKEVKRAMAEQSTAQNEIYSD